MKLLTVTTVRTERIKYEKRVPDDYPIPPNDPEAILDMVNEDPDFEFDLVSSDEDLVQVRLDPLPPSMRP